MPKDIHTQDSSQQRASRLLLAMGVIVLLGALAYFGLTLAVNRRTPANPDTLSLIHISEPTRRS